MIGKCFSFWVKRVIENALLECHQLLKVVSYQTLTPDSRIPDSHTEESFTPTGVGDKQHTESLLNS